MVDENFQNEWKKLPRSVKEREIEEIAIAFTYNTNAIEGSKITLIEAREIIKDLDLKLVEFSITNIKDIPDVDEMYIDVLWLVPDNVVSSKNESFS